MVKIASLHLSRKLEFFTENQQKPACVWTMTELNMLENPYNNFGLTILMDLRYNLIL